MSYSCDYMTISDLPSDELYEMLQKDLLFFSSEFADAPLDKNGEIDYLLNRECGLLVEIFNECESDLSPLQQERYGFVPNLRIRMTPPKGHHPRSEEGDQNMIRTVSWFLENIDADAVFMANSDTMVLLRIGGQTWLDDTGEFWREVDLPLIKVPFSRKTLVR